MNSWKLNGMAGHLSRNAIINGLKIKFTELYRVIKNIDSNNIIHLHDGRSFKLELKELNPLNTNDIENDNIEDIAMNFASSNFYIEDMKEHIEVKNKLIEFYNMIKNNTQ